MGGLPSVWRRQVTAFLEARDVGKVFGGGLFTRSTTVALDGISLAISADEPSITVIAGESGSGKTTLARLLLGIIAPTSGEVLYKGQSVGRLPREARRVFRREVQAIFQDPFEVYNPFYKVDHVLTTPVAKFGLADSADARRQFVEEALEVVGLRAEETLGRYPHQLSGGQRQRVMVARALLLRPKVIVADEAVSMVDASLRATILESLLKLHADLGISLVYITHDLTTAYQLGEKIMILYQGRVSEVGDIELVIKNPKHPYTQLLVSSIPLPDPEKPWSGVEDTGRPTGSQDGTRRGCLFADRCPYVMDICLEETPPLYVTESNRASACHLYEGSPVADSTASVGVVAQATKGNQAGAGNTS